MYTQVANILYTFNILQFNITRYCIQHASIKGRFLTSFELQKDSFMGDLYGIVCQLYVQK